MIADQGFVEEGQCGGRLLFSFTVAIVGCLYVILVPLASYLCGTVMSTFDAEMPKGVAMLISMSPWLPLGIGSIGIAMLFWGGKSKRNGWRVGSRVASVAVMITGALWVALTLIPVLQLMAALPK